jgi:hypothetical protein
MQTPRHRAAQQASWWRFSSHRGLAAASSRSGPACAPACPNSLGAATRGEWFATVGSAGGGNARRRAAGTGSAAAQLQLVLQRISRAPLVFGCGASLGMLAGRLHIAPSARCRLRTECGLTPRSSRPAPAGAAWPLRAIVVIVPPRPVGSCLHGRLSSNVRPHLAWSCRHRGIGLRSEQAGRASRRVEVLRRLQYGQGRRARRPVLTALAPLRAASSSPPSAAPGSATLSARLRARGSGAAPLQLVLQRISRAPLVFGCGASLGMLAGRLHIAPSARCRLRTECGLTPRSSRPAPAGAAWPLRAIVVIVPPRPVGSCLHGRLSSNVRPH